MTDFEVNTTGTHNMLEMLSDRVNKLTEALDNIAKVAEEINEDPTLWQDHSSTNRHLRPAALHSVGQHQRAMSRLISIIVLNLENASS